MCRTPLWESLGRGKGPGRVGERIAAREQGEAGEGKGMGGRRKCTSWKRRGQRPGAREAHARQTRVHPRGLFAWKSRVAAPTPLRPSALLRVEEAKRLHRVEETKRPHMEALDLIRAETLDLIHAEEIKRPFSRGGDQAPPHGRNRTSHVE